MKKIKEFIPIILILLIAAVLRLLWLDRVPGAINGDELHYILAIKSVALTGHDFNSSWNILPIIFFRYPPGVVQAELPYLLLFLPVGFLNLSILTSRFLFSLLSLGTVFTFYLLGRKLFDERAGLVAAVVCAINPWQIFMGRTAYEVVPAAFFYLLAIYFLISQKANRILISIPFFILAFYSYIGTKIILIPIVVVVTIYAFISNKRRYRNQYLIVNIACILITLFFAVTAFTGATSRTSELYTPFSSEVTNEVNLIRKGSIGEQNFIDKLLTNRLTVYANSFNTRVMDALSFKSTFSETDTFVSLYRSGFFYFLDALFLIIGCLFMFVDKRKEFYLIASLIFLGIVPQIMFITGKYFSPHLALFYLFLILPIAYGISRVIAKGKIIFLAVVLLYLFSFINFANIYFQEFPKQGHFDFPARELSKYISIASEKNPQVKVFVKSPEDIFNKYIYYSNKLNSQNYNAIENSYKNKEYKIGNVKFVNCGDIISDYNPKVTTIYQADLCAEYSTSSSRLKIAQMSDGGEVYRIYNDNICSKYNLDPYPQGINISDFSLEQLSTQRFCEVFISN